MAAHGPIEPRAAVASWQDGTLRVWAGTQDAFYIRDFLADAFGLPLGSVTVQSCRIGGAFGGKTICTVEAEAAALTLAMGSAERLRKLLRTASAPTFRYRPAPAACSA